MFRCENCGSLQDDQVLETDSLTGFNCRRCTAIVFPQYRIISQEITFGHLLHAEALIALIDTNLEMGYHYRDDDGRCLLTLDQVIVAIEAGKFLGDSSEKKTETEKSRGRNTSKTGDRVGGAATARGAVNGAVSPSIG